MCWIPVADKKERTVFRNVNILIVLLVLVIILIDIVITFISNIGTLFNFIVCEETIAISTGISYGYLY